MGAGFPLRFLGCHRGRFPLLKAPWLDPSLAEGPDPERQAAFAVPGWSSVRQRLG